MKILIIEDNVRDIQNLISCINRFFLYKNYDYKIDVCTDINSLFKNIFNYDLIFLDIQIREENGIDIGLKIRKYNPSIRIIITSGYYKYLIEGYKIHAERYFIKPITQNEFNIEFEDVVKNHFEDFEGFYDKKIYMKKLYFKDMIYIEFVNRKTNIHLPNSKILSSSYTLKKWEEILKNQPFHKPHKAYIINMRYINSINNYDILLSNGETIPLSRHYKREFQIFYLAFLQKRF